MVLKFHTNIAKWLEINVRTFWRLIPTFIGVTVEKLVARAVLQTPHPE